MTIVCVEKVSLVDKYEFFLQGGWRVGRSIYG